MADSVVSPYSLEAIDQMLRQKRATGQYVSDSDRRLAYEGALEADAQKELQARALEERQKEFAQQLAFQQKVYKDQQSANMWTGLFGAGKFAMDAYDSPLGKKVMGWFGKDKPAVPWKYGFGDQPQPQPAVSPAVSEAATPSNLTGATGRTGGMGEAVPAFNYQQPAYQQPSGQGFLDPNVANGLMGLSGFSGGAPSGFNYGYGGGQGNVDYFPEFTNLFSFDGL